eukprot:TRINITY_DN32973_c0_g1_i1.p1 TRINITY_DN32973_c0_g1~~TRINITY_DN32973_c0_g1_i1.p1  ORF type:complete len:343 (+),score=49.42 TRINITY_DN32973_c0_g1_i1:156-1031(+)
MAKEMPVVGFGIGSRWKNPQAGTELNQDLIAAIRSALEVGYRLFDAAEVYNTERELGVALKESSVPREELFITTKVLKKVDNIKGALRDSLSLLQLDYVDLYLIHAPFFFPPNEDLPLKQIWKEMEEVLAEGLTKRIGVSSHQIPHLREVLASGTVKPYVNQIEVHPYLQEDELIAFCAANSIRVQSFCGLTSLRAKPGGPVDAVVTELAKKHDRTDSQILLRWALERGLVSITTSSNPERQREMFAIQDFSLPEEDVQRISDAGMPVKYRAWFEKQIDALLAKEGMQGST